MLRDICRNIKGLTTIEIVTSIFLSSLVFGGVFAFFSHFSTVSELKEDFAEIQTRGKAAMYVLVRDAMRAGEGLDDLEEGSEPLCMIPGGWRGEQDSIAMVYRAADTPVTYLKNPPADPREPQKFSSSRLYVENVQQDAFGPEDRLLIYSEDAWAIVTLNRKPVVMDELLLLWHDPEKAVLQPGSEELEVREGTKVVKIYSVEFSYDSKKAELQKRINNHPRKKLIGGIERIAFHYETKNGTFTDKPRDFRAIRSLRINLALKSLKESEESGSRRRLMLTQDVTPRLFDS